MKRLANCLRTIAEWLDPQPNWDADIWHAHKPLFKLAETARAAALERRPRITRKHGVWWCERDRCEAMGAGKTPQDAYKTWVEMIL